MEGRRTIDDETSFMLMTQPTNQPLQVFFILLNLLFLSLCLASRKMEQMQKKCIFYASSCGIIEAIIYLRSRFLAWIEERGGFCQIRPRVIWPVCDYLALMRFSLARKVIALS